MIDDHSMKKSSSTITYRSIISLVNQSQMVAYTYNIENGTVL